MNPLHNVIQQQVVTPMLNKRMHPIKAVITDFDNETNLAEVEFNNPFGPGVSYIEGVPVQIGAIGIHSAGPFPGDEVWLAFLNGSENNPRIIGFVDEQAYKINIREKRLKHSRKGVNVPDSITRR